MKNNKLTRKWASDLSFCLMSFLNILSKILVGTKGIVSFGERMTHSLPMSLMSPTAQKFGKSSLEIVLATRWKRTFLNKKLKTCENNPYKYHCLSTEPLAALGISVPCNVPLPWVSRMPHSTCASSLLPSPPFWEATEPWRSQGMSGSSSAVTRTSKVCSGCFCHLPNLPMLWYDWKFINHSKMCPPTGLQEHTEQF